MSVKTVASDSAHTLVSSIVLVSHGDSLRATGGQYVWSEFQASNQLTRQLTHGLEARGIKVDRRAILPDDLDKERQEYKAAPNSSLFIVVELVSAKNLENSLPVPLDPIFRIQVSNAERSLASYEAHYRGYPFDESVAKIVYEKILDAMLDAQNRLK